jgi:hypothetical protein
MYKVKEGVYEMVFRARLCGCLGRVVLPGCLNIGLPGLAAKKQEGAGNADHKEKKNSPEPHSNGCLQRPVVTNH